MKLAKRENKEAYLKKSNRHGHDFKRLVVVEQERRSRQDWLITPVKFIHHVAAIGRKDKTQQILLARGKSSISS